MEGECGLPSAASPDPHTAALALNMRASGTYLVKDASMTRRRFDRPTIATFTANIRIESRYAIGWLSVGTCQSSPVVVLPDSVLAHIVLLAVWGFGLAGLQTAVRSRAFHAPICQCHVDNELRGNLKLKDRSYFIAPRESTIRALMPCKVLLNLWTHSVWPCIFRTQRN